jgi:hypothetical protein
MPLATVDYLKGYFGINLIKNRPKIETQDQGYLVPVHASGRVTAPKGSTLSLCQPGGGGPF